MKIAYCLETCCIGGILFEDGNCYQVKVGTVSNTIEEIRHNILKEWVKADSQHTGKFNLESLEGWL